MPGRNSPQPSAAETVAALRQVADLLGREVCYAHQGRFHFCLTGDWTLALSAESAGRFRLETCHLSAPSATVAWTLAMDRSRLEMLTLALANEVTALV